MTDLQKSGVIFARVSSREQKDEGFSLDAQKKIMIQYAEDRGIKVKPEALFEVAETASTSEDRKQFQACIAYLYKNKIDCLIIEKADRMTRNFKDYIMTQEWIEGDEARELHAVKNGFVISKNAKSVDMYMWQMFVANAEFMARNLSEEVRKGMGEKFNQGWLPQRAYVGYKSVNAEGSKRKKHVIDEETAPLVRRAFELYADDGTLESVAEKMRMLGMKNTIGNPVTKNSIDKLLDTSFYIGKIRWKGVEINGKQEAIISQELWEAVQLKKHGSLVALPKYKKHSHFLRCLITCENCGKAVVWQTQKKHWYGHCNKSCHQLLNGSYSKEEGVIEHLMGVVRKGVAKSDETYDWIGKHVKQYISDNNESAYADTQKIEDSLSVVRRKQKMAYEDRLNGLIDLEKCKTKLAELEVEEKNLETELAKLSVGRNMVADTAFKLLSLCEQAHSRFNTDNDEIKREIISFYFSRITWDGKELKAEVSELALLVISLVDFAEKQKQAVELVSDPCFSGAFAPQNPTWQGHVESNHDLRFWRPLY